MPFGSCRRIGNRVRIPGGSAAVIGEDASFGESRSLGVSPEKADAVPTIHEPEDLLRMMLSRGAFSAKDGLLCKNGWQQNFLLPFFLWGVWYDQSEKMDAAGLPGACLAAASGRWDGFSPDSPGQAGESHLCCVEYAASRDDAPGC